MLMRRFGVVGLVIGVVGLVELSCAEHVAANTSTFRVYRTLVFPCGSGIGLEIADALGSLKEVQLFGATSKSSTPTHCEHVYPSIVDDLPAIGSDDALALALLQVVRDENIDAIFPGLDDATTYFARYRDVLESTGAVVLLPSEETVRIARSKRLTYDVFRDSEYVPVPRIFDVADAALLEYPVFVKPERGQGSHGAKRVDDAADLRAHARSVVDPVVLEYLPGREYTIDCFADRERGLLFARARQRRRIRGGISVATSPLFVAARSDETTVSKEKDGNLVAGDRDDWIEPMARAIQITLRFHGAFFFQVKESVDGRPVLMEVAPRIAGSMALFRFAGVNLPLLTIYEAFRRPVRILPLDDVLSEYELEIMDKAYVNRLKIRGLDAYRAVYVDLDDTLVLHEARRLNTRLVRFLYQCVDRDVRIVLITRSKMRHPTEVLERFRLKSLFDRVVHVVDSAVTKSSVILSDMESYVLGDEETSCDSDRPKTSASAIFIDDSFRERLDVLENVGIPVFDCSMIAALIDDRPPSAGP